MSPRRFSVFRAATRRFRTARQGSAAVEFAFIAPVFFGLLFAILDAAMIFFAGQTLETATQASARLILTGQAQNGNYTAAQFKTDFCNNIAALITCSGVYLDVESYSSFSNVTIATPSCTSSFSGMSYNPGTSGDVVVVRAYYQWPLFVPNFGFNPSQSGTNCYLLTGTAAFRNEPYANSN
jgi:Flp pilus assembly protein TadG